MRRNSKNRKKVNTEPEQFGYISSEGITLKKEKPDGLNRAQRRLNKKK